jgi:hypothetical protein
VPAAHCGIPFGDDKKQSPVSRTAAATLFQKRVTGENLRLYAKKGEYATGIFPRLAKNRTTEQISSVKLLLKGAVSEAD